jgi:hypothetical protein
MGYINLPPSLYNIFQDIILRVQKLETAQRFTFPNVTTDPTNPRTGDAWLNTTSNTAKIVDKNGTVRVITWT